jgi:acyl-CoA thioesterase II
LIRMEQTGPGCFRNLFSDMDFQGGHMFGGQLVAQALAAAMLTLDGRQVHSLHGYFLRPGDVREGIDYAVERVRDGRSFATRRVRAGQGGKALFEMLCSASTGESGPMDHQARPPADVPAPESLRTMADCLADPAFANWHTTIERLSPMPLADCRPVDPERLFRPGSGGPLRVWLRMPSLAGSLDAATQACMVAYLQDYWIAFAPWAYQALPFEWERPSVASLDSNVWFHRPAPADWLLYELESPAGSGGIGLTVARLLDREGRVIASTAQEVLFRMA